jgi:hypothetical protein
MLDKQEFEKYPALTEIIQHFASHVPVRLDEWSMLLAEINAALQAASQPPAVRGIDATPFETNTDRHSVTGLTTGEYELAFIPCATDDPRRIGAYQSTDGESECCVRELHLPVQPTGAVWVKGEYERLYDRLKAGVERPIPCFVNYNWDRKDKTKIMRDICTVRTDFMDFSARGIGYGGASHVIPESEREEFLEECERLSVEWLDESGESPTAAGDGKEAIEFADWINRQGLEARYSDDGKSKCWFDYRGRFHTSYPTTAQLYDIYQREKQHPTLV